MRTRTVWTKEDIQFMRDNVNIFTNKQIALILGKTEHAVMNAICVRRFKRKQSILSKMRSNDMPKGEDSPNWKGGRIVALARYKPKMILTRRKYRDTYPERVIADRIFTNAKRKGLIKSQPCEICNQIFNVEGHHDDYNKPLEVRWLCKKHHREYHMNLKWRIQYDKADDGNNRYNSNNTIICERSRGTETDNKFNRMEYYGGGHGKRDK